MKLAPSLKPASFLKLMPLFAKAEPLAATPTSSAFEAPRPGSTPGPWFPSALQLAGCARNAAVWLAAGAALVLGPGLPQKAAAQAKAEPAYTLTGNAAVVSDYRYRGMTQTSFDPALQVGADLALPNGLYLGAFATNIKWVKDDLKVNKKSGGGSVEIDIYGGVKFEIFKGLTADVGFLTYQYPGNDYATIDPKLTRNANTTELYGGLVFGVTSFKYYQAVTPLFGIGDTAGSGDSKGSSYIDLSASFDLGDGFTLAPHFGRQRVANNSSWTYSDYSLGISKDFSGFVLGLSFVGVDIKDANKANYQTPKSEMKGKSAVVFSAKYNF